MLLNQTSLEGGMNLGNINELDKESRAKKQDFQRKTNVFTVAAAIMYFCHEYLPIEFKY